MNKVTLYIIIAIATILMSSCDKDIDKKNITLDEYESDYGELVEKYADMKFANCAEAISAGNEIASVLYSTADKAFKENDAKAKSDLDNFGELLSAYDHVIDSMYTICPEDFDKWEKSNRKKIETILHKASSAFDAHSNDTVWGEDVTSEIEAVNEQVEQLMIDIQQFADEDDSINGIK